ncbi:hypothetical protein EWM64_g7673 [Hericium alpestre]|uniref:F-box domain-containing protein n=1 Tax=Hericium alpestre TaxID=135208 RepID=A0A4Y9ZNH0_9AGAM|nr:hypothetical protein EWM64_g7673 [Hericium alpestre]
MNRFTAEISSAVTDGVSTKDLHALRIVNKAWSVAATPRLFRRIEIQDSLSSVNALKNVLMVEELAGHVREIVYRSQYVDQDGQPLRKCPNVDFGASIPLAGIQYGMLKPHPVIPENGISMSPEEHKLIDALKETFGLIAKARHLSTLKLLFSPHSTDNPDGFEFCSSFEILEAVVGVSKAISLRSLTLVNIAVADESVYERPEFMALLRGLSQLQITVVSNEKLDPKINRDYPDDPWSIFWEDIMFQRILPSLNGSSALTHLVLHSGEHIGIKPTFSFKALHFPCLSSLSLMRITFDEKIGTEDFIIRHKATLSRLELYRCLLLVHFDEDKPARLWSQIWDRFAKELTGLKEFMLSTEWDQNARRDKYGDYEAVQLDRIILKL